MSMQDELNILIKEVSIAPLFKEMGFKKKGSNFAKRLTEVAWCVNIQSSKWNTKRGYWVYFKYRSLYGQIIWNFL